MKLKVVLLGSLLFFAACTAKVEGGNESGENPFSSGGSEEFTNKISGPDVEGNWSSDCTYDSYDKIYRLRKISFVAQQISRTNNTYKDSSCTQIKKQDVLTGIYRWAATTNYGGFQLDYRFDLNGGYIETKEELLIENKQMYVSNFHVNFGQIDKDLPMKKINVTPLPPENPGNPPATQCPNLSGTFISSSANYLSISQKACSEIIWQALRYDLTPDGSPEVYLTDGQYHLVGGDNIKAGYKNSAFTVEFNDQGYSYLMSFEITKATSACGTSFGSEKTILLRTTTVNGAPSSQNCRYWQKQ